MIIVFGASLMCERVVSYLEKLGIVVDMICSNDKNQYGCFVTDSGRMIEIVSTEEAMSDGREKLVFIATGDQHFKVIAGQIKQYEIAETVMRWHLDFYLEAMIMFFSQSASFMDQVVELLNLYEDEESFKVLWKHLNMLFEMENIPKALKTVTWESLCIPHQYFLKEGKYLGKQGIMIDVGAYIGDTLEDLINRIKYNNFEWYDCYEIDLGIYEKLKKTVYKLPMSTRMKVRIFNVGAGKDDSTVKISFNDSCTAISNRGEVVGRTVRLDDVYQGKNVTFIKMDIEGAEQMALQGAENVISKCKPMCAICSYHSLAAFWEIPQMLKRFVPEYKLLLRHHSICWDESVCYAKLGEWKD